MTDSAFPILEQGGNGLELTDVGMSLRDYFAAQVLPVIVTDYRMRNDKIDRTGAIGIALDAYRIAEGMMGYRAAILKENKS